MQIELNQTTFRRLVKVYLLAVVLGLGSVILEWFVWSDFSAAFDGLVVSHFGEPGEVAVVVLGVVAVVAVVVHFVAAFGLLHFRRWARTVFWASMLPILSIGVLPSMGTSWSGFMSSVTDMIASGLFGAVLLLAYAQDHGAAWFHKPTLEEIF